MPDAPTQAEIITRLQGESDYSASGAQLMARRLSSLSGQVAGVFGEWWQGGEVPELAIEGYTVSRLMEEQGHSVYAAFVTLDWLEREPQEALAVLERH